MRTRSSTRHPLLVALIGAGPDPWNRTRCGRPYVLRRAKSLPLRPKTWPFGLEPSDPDADSPAVFCASCSYPDGTIDVLTFNSRLGSVTRSEGLDRALEWESGR